MARRRIEGAVIEKKTNVSRETLKVQFMPVEARNLATIDERSPVWKGIPIVIGGTFWPGAIARVRPPPDATDAMIESLRCDLIKAGVAKVTVLARRKGETVPQKVLEERTKFRSLGPREVVLRLIYDSNSDAKQALIGIAEEVMNGVGL